MGGIRLELSPNGGHEDPQEIALRVVKTPDIGEQLALSEELARIAS
jgi:hypothetical protein